MTATDFHRLDEPELATTKREFYESEYRHCVLDVQHAVEAFGPGSRQARQAGEVAERVRARLRAVKAEAIA